MWKTLSVLGYNMGERYDTETFPTSWNYEYFLDSPKARPVTDVLQFKKNMACITGHIYEQKVSLCVCVSDCDD